jgi:hypothetical protein
MPSAYLCFEEWQRLRFAPVELAAGEGGEGADPDGDGLSNALEYALNLDPRRGDPASGFRMQAAGTDDGEFLTISYVKNRLASDPPLAVQICGDLRTAAWQDVEGGAQLHGRTDLGNGLEKVTLRFRRPDSMPDTVFARLRILGP